MIRKFLSAYITLFLLATTAYSQQITTAEGRCNSDIAWTFDGHTLILVKNNIQKTYAEMPNYDVKTNPAPWIKRKFPIKRVVFGNGIINIGACAFAECETLETVEYANGNSIREIGWGAFLRCKRLFNFSIPSGVVKIGKVAFAECAALRSVTVPEQTRVDDYAFLSCTNLNLLDLAVNSLIGKSVFAIEVKDGDNIRHTYYQGEIKSLPANINANNCYAYGLNRAAVEEFINRQRPDLVNVDQTTSAVDEDIPESLLTRNDTYALILGNQHYRFAPDVPYAMHDARVFAQYCKKTLGIPAEQVHLCEDVTKTMLLEQELEDWLQKEITDKTKKRLIVYYAGHGVPDINDHNKAYLLPTDVRGTHPERGIALDKFYATIGNLGFRQVTVILDACFSGINRDSESLNVGERAVEIEAEDTNPTTGNMVVFCAAQGNETAQGYQQEGHGLFTYYLLKELKDNRGVITFERLAQNLMLNVSTTAVQLELRKKQTPTTRTSGALDGSLGKYYF